MHKKLINSSLILKVEIIFYFCVWITAIIYSIYRFSCSSTTFFQKYNDLYGDFERGIPFLSPKRDKADFEWETILYFLKNIYPWGILYVCITEVTIKCNLSSKLVEKLDSWSFYGFGYAMGQHFHIKYIVIYGLSTSLASFENVSVPHLPRCIGRIHLYSDMWKYFDAGLYKFLVRHIYIPIVKLTSHKLLASMTTFAFVYIWHGTASYILIWCILNYIGIVIEQTCSSLFSVKKKEMDESHSDWSRRTKCFFGALLLAVSAISNFYFFGGKQIGDLFFQRVLTDNLFNTVILVSILYCGAQVSTELQLMHARKCDNNAIK
nr:unnamed protein product [Callosobruchus analis]